MPAEDIKRDLGLADEDIGFLYGTAFVIFHTLFGIPLGRLAVARIGSASPTGSGEAMLRDRWSF